MQFNEINPSPRLLMCPGPVAAEPRVLRAMATPIIGQFEIGRASCRERV